MGVEHFDNVYSSCVHKVYTDCVCNNGYICNSKENTEECENNPMFSKCYSFSCPLVDDGVTREQVRESKDYSEEDIIFDDDFSIDSEQLVFFHEDIETDVIKKDDVATKQEIETVWIEAIFLKKGYGYVDDLLRTKRGVPNFPPFDLIFYKNWLKLRKSRRTIKSKKGKKQCKTQPGR